MTSYEDFLWKRSQLDSYDGVAIDPQALDSRLLPFQRDLTAWALQKGRAALYTDCGTGKTFMQLVWAENVRRITGRPVLIVTPLAVSYQTEAEARKFGIEAAVSRNGDITAPIVVTNYDRIHLFSPDDFAGLVCDESSAIKSFDGERRRLITDFARKLRWRLLCTATAAPNDYIELGTSSEALGYLGHMDMLSRFFTNDQKSTHAVRTWEGADWRFKGHAEGPFWRWVSSWARAMRRPSDLGYSDEGFILPPLNVREHVVKPATPAAGRLFDLPAVGLREEREELRRTLRERCETAAALLQDAQPGIAWCHLNSEGDLLTKLIPGAVQVSGSEPAEDKEQKLMAFVRGEIRVMVTKPLIAGWGLNLQHCHRIVYFPSHSYEQYYQAVRRCWRFGQQSPVTVDLVTTPGGAGAQKSLERKSAQMDRMFAQLVEHMRDALGIARVNPFTERMELPAWLAS